MLSHTGRERGNNEDNFSSTATTCHGQHGQARGLTNLFRKRSCMPCATAWAAPSMASGRPHDGAQNVALLVKAGSGDLDALGWTPSARSLDEVNEDGKQGAKYQHHAGDGGAAAQHGACVQRRRQRVYLLRGKGIRQLSRDHSASKPHGGRRAAHQEQAQKHPPM